MRSAFLLGAALSVAACATVVRGTKETSKFESAPAGATAPADAAPVAESEAAPVMLDEPAKPASEAGDAPSE